MSTTKLGPALVVAMAISFGCDAPETQRDSLPTGTIEGVVRLEGAGDWAPTRIENTTDPETCGRGQTLDDLIVSESGGLRHAIVALVEVPGTALGIAPPGRVEIDNDGCRFSPHAWVATVGSTLEAVNSDAVLHTTHLYGPADMNISLPVQGARATRELTRPGLYIVKCDIHGWMQAFVRVDPHALHAVTDAEGRFRIEGVPLGAHRVEVWHERLGTQQIEVEVEAGRTSSLAVSFPQSTPN